ncbi:putative inositol polyphosphate 1-phosphatase [Leishmania major strain Friedlin]|uniref:3'(2'),5'-bisphosphate nucleotidase n=1 Tax=Leishmania major TaxID=5664 RepID=Q4Q5W6_LEIMA|nr:putative inositol polyphosphate 1-phosphatase [Leishmania major strain Friedlin]CAG9579477.1 inositol_polyphosphate_1-phosphatase_-_putative [Leishmania major strain Friedlin]CAJ08541.1 putative inositol polyphosphate 1-phosphatase [Leishmania major strain Friedlin]|eukprot:XP_001685282.1 putative inositol polyphosphate 1-phosphatase [Leishmania major strain Friedlin]
MAKHYKAIFAMSYEAELYAHLQASQRFNAGADAAVVLHADSDEAMRRHLGISIDPINGTNCCVGGVWQAPMTLVGIALDGVPIAGVMNRIFDYPLTCTYGPAATEPQEKACVPGLAVVLNTPTPASPFVVFDGGLVPAPGQMEQQLECTCETPLAVCRSSTTKEVFLQRLLTQLEPCNAVYSRGAGYKQYHLLKKMLTGRHVAHEAITPADIFVCPPGTIEKWDCCVVHAFLYALGGEIFDQNGVPIRYPLVGTYGAATTSLSEIAALTDGLVAVTPYAMHEVARRLGWTLTLAP